jgi:hypothetical protein
MIMQVVEMEHEDGYRFWSKPMPDSDVSEYIKHFESLGYSVSDIDYPASDLDEDGETWDDDDHLTDAEADAMTLASAGYGTDEDYGYYGDDFEGGW